MRNLKQASSQSYKVDWGLSEAREGMNGELLNWYRISTGDDRKVVEWIMSLVTQYCECT